MFSLTLGVERQRRRRTNNGHISILFENVVIKVPLSETLANVCSGELLCVCFETFCAVRVCACARPIITNNNNNNRTPKTYTITSISAEYWVAANTLTHTTTMARRANYTREWVAMDCAHIRNENMHRQCFARVPPRAHALNIHKAPAHSTPHAIHIRIVIYLRLRMHVCECCVLEI